MYPTVGSLASPRSGLRRGAIIILKFPWMCNAFTFVSSTTFGVS